MSVLALPMPTCRPSLRPITQPTGPPTCRLHGQDSPYTRNTMGDYSSFAPPCCGILGGCLVGERERTERRQIRELFRLLDLCDDAAADDPQSIAPLLLRIRAIRDSLSADLHTPRQRAEDVLRRFDTVTVTVTG